MIPEEIQKKIEAQADQEYLILSDPINDTKKFCFEQGAKFGYSLRQEEVDGLIKDRDLQLDEKETMMYAFGRIRIMFEMRAWIMEGRGSYPYNDDRYKEEVRYLFDEFTKVCKETWKQIETKSFEYRKEIESKQSSELSRLQSEVERLKGLLGECENELQDLSEYCAGHDLPTWEKHVDKLLTKLKEV